MTSSPRKSPLYSWRTCMDVRIWNNTEVMTCLGVFGCCIRVEKAQKGEVLQHIPGILLTLYVRIVDSTLRGKKVIDSKHRFISKFCAPSVPDTLFCLRNGASYMCTIRLRPLTYQSNSLTARSKGIVEGNGLPVNLRPNLPHHT